MQGFQNDLFVQDAGARRAQLAHVNRSALHSLLEDRPMTTDKTASKSCTCPSCTCANCACSPCTCATCSCSAGTCASGCDCGTRRSASDDPTDAAGTVHRRSAGRSNPLRSSRLVPRSIVSLLLAVVCVLLLHFVLQRRMSLDVVSDEASSQRVVQLSLMMRSTTNIGDEIPQSGLAQ